MMLGAPGQRETIRGGRDQDLLTPIWQTVALCVCGAWVLGWTLALALVVGDVLGYGLSMLVFLRRWGKKIVNTPEPRTLYECYYPTVWTMFNIVVHVASAWALSLIWTTYILAWSPWAKMLWTLLCTAMAVPAGVLMYTLGIRLLDPNYPSPRKAVEQRQWQRPWDMDRPAQQLATGPITMPTTNRNGNHTQYRYPQIPTPRAGREQLARWFWRIVRQGGEGFSQGVAQNPYRIQRKECKEIQDRFIAEELAEDRGGTQGIRPNAAGLDKMWEIVTEFYPTAPLPPDRAQGV